MNSHRTCFHFCHTPLSLLILGLVFTRPSLIRLYTAPSHSVLVLRDLNITYKAHHYPSHFFLHKVYQTSKLKPRPDCLDSKSRKATMDSLKGAFNSFTGGSGNQNPNQQHHGQGQGQNYGQGQGQGYNQGFNQGEGQNQGYNQGGFNQGQQQQSYNQGQNQGYSSMQDGNQQGSSGGGFLGGLTNKFNSAAGGGPESEKNEDYLDKGA